MAIIMGTATWAIIMGGATWAIIMGTATWAIIMGGATWAIIMGAATWAIIMGAATWAIIMGGATWAIIMGSATVRHGLWVGVYAGVGAKGCTEDAAGVGARECRLACRSGCKGLYGGCCMVKHTETMGIHRTSYREATCMACMSRKAVCMACIGLLLWHA